MEFITLPPEITSGLIHSGPGAESLFQASRAWQKLGKSLEESAEDYGAAVSSLTSTWHGASSAAMVQAVEPYVAWLRTTAQQTQQTAVAAQAAAAAFNSARAAVVPTTQVMANRTRLAQLIATNGFGRNLPAIAETEAEYQSMWANNSAAMSRYQAASAQATTLPQFSSPAATTNPAGAASQSAVSTSATSAAASTSAGTSAATSAQAGDLVDNGWFQLANTYANQFISSGFPINLLSYLAQNTSAQALQGVNSQIGQGVSEGEGALGGLGGLGRIGAGGLGSLGPGALGAAGLGQASTSAATGVGVSIGKLTAPPAVVGLLPASQAPVQLASAATPISAGEAGLPMLPPIMPPPLSAGSGWRKRKQPKYEDIEIGAELKGKVMDPPPSAG